MKKYTQQIKSSLLYCLYLLFVLIVADVVLLRHTLGFGYPSHYEQENIHRYPAPYVEFTAKPNVRDHNEFGFRGKSFLEVDSGAIKIAFFGGSTGYNGTPPISDILELELKKRWNNNVFIANYSVVSSNHRQHLHAILEYTLQFKPDIIVFYGGYNETQHPINYDPRPGYPYNFFYRGELPPFRQTLLRYSAISGEIDKRFGIISGISKLRSEYEPLSIEWNSKIIQKYFETLHLASTISSTIESSYFGNCRFFAFYQPYKVPDTFIATHLQIRKGISKVPYIYDVSQVYDLLDENETIFTDAVHVHQPARELMGKTVAKIIFDTLDSNDILSEFTMDNKEKLR
tara:strand:+ start:1085 stop:2116 length:1032 start_codon:yes stop_codon:yes gene_type:complete